MSDRFAAFDPAEKPRPPPPPAAVAAPLYHAESQRQATSTSAPPLSDDARFARQYHPPGPQPFHPQAPPQYQYQQQQQYQQPQRSYGGQALPDSYDRGSLRHQQSQQPPPPMYTQQGSFQYYPPGQHASQQAPLLPLQYSTDQQGYPTNGVAFHPVVRRRPQRSPKQQFLMRMLKLVGFHAMNAILGFTAFSLLGVGVSSSMSLLPLCCFGIVIFRVVLYGVHVLAQLDVMLYNFISPPQEKVFLEKPLEPGIAGEVLAPSLESFSPLSLLALLYFMSIKFVVAVLSTMSAGMTVFPIVALVVNFCGGKADIMAGPIVYSYRKDGMAFVIVAVCLTVISAALMILAAKVSTKATKFFCCERFSTYPPLEPLGYQQQARQPLQQFTVRSYVSYGSST